MAIIRACHGISPTIGERVFLADTAVVVGDVVLGDECSVWWGAVIRGDVHSIRIGAQTNIQDGAILHCTYQKASLNIGSRVSIGHAAIVHGCTVDERVLIGIGAKLLDHCHVPSDVLIAAGSLVREGERLESGYLYAGLPAKKIKPLTDEQLALIRRLPDNYIMYAQWFPELVG
jgi:carbonic anhydrase/acetyltransferase-like protein (isoleucine patch superfamily)